MGREGQNEIISLAIKCFSWQKPKLPLALSAQTTQRMWPIWPWPAHVLGQRKTAAPPASGRARTQARTAGASTLFTLYAKLSVDGNRLQVSGSELLAWKKRCFSCQDCGSGSVFNRARPSPNDWIFSWEQGKLSRKKSGPRLEEEMGKSKEGTNRNAATAHTDTEPQPGSR